MQNCLYQGCNVAAVPVLRIATLVREISGGKVAMAVVMAGRDQIVAQHAAPERARRSPGRGQIGVSKTEAR